MIGDRRWRGPASHRSRLHHHLAAALLLAAVGCGESEPDLVAFAVAGENPVDDTVWCEPDDIVADLTSTTPVPPSIEVPPLGEAEAQAKAEDFVAMVFASGSAARPGLVFQHDGGPTATVTLTWPSDDEPADALAAGWLTFERLGGDWTITGYTVCNRFAFGG